jgi:predicted esterase
LSFADGGRGLDQRVFARRACVSALSCAVALACTGVQKEETARAPDREPLADAGAPASPRRPAGPAPASAIEPVPEATAAAPAAEPVSRAAAPAAAPASEPIPEGIQPLAVGDFLPALVSWPQAKQWPQPVLVAAHGAGDNAQAHCELWRRLLERRGVVLCLRGRALSRGSEERGYYFSDHHSLKREALAALDALSRSSPHLVDTDGVVYAGYSQGAQMGLLMLADQGARAPRLLLVEGGAGDWSLQRARSFARSGGRAVALVCGTPGCNRNAERSHGRLEAAGVRVTTHYAPGAGHVYWGAVEPHLIEAFAGLTKDDQRWGPSEEHSAGDSPAPPAPAAGGSSPPH